MTILIRDLRTIWSEFDAGGAAIDGEGANNTKSLFTADPNPIEGTGSIGRAIGNETISTFVTSTSVNVDNALVYGWTLVSPPVAASNATDPGIGILLGDGTNRNGYGLIGSNKAGFRHNATNPDWQAIVLDTSLIAGGTTYSTPTTDLDGGNGVDPTLTTITEIGYFTTRLSAARGGIENAFYDIVRYGLNGIQLLGDSANAITTFFDIDSDGRSGNDKAAYAAVREVGANAFSLMSRITFGDSANGNRGLNFDQKASTILWDDVSFAPVGTTGVTVPRMRLISSAPTTAPTLGPSTTSIRFGRRTGDGTGDRGCTFATPVQVDVDFTNQNVDSVGIYGSVFRDFYQHEFRQDKTVAASKHEVFQTDFINCGSVYVGGISFKNNSIFGSTETGADSAAVHLIQTDNVSGLFFSSPGTGHAISIDSAITNQAFVFTNFEYTGYASTTGNTGNEVLINNSGQPITVQISGGNTPTVDSDGVRGKVTIVNNITTTISGVLGNSEIKVLPTSGSPYSGNTLNDTLSIATETVSADTFVGDGTNYYRYSFWSDGGTNRIRLVAEGSATFSGVLTDGDAASTPLANGDRVRVTIRDDVDNPTLQLFDEFTIDTVVSNSQLLFNDLDAVDFSVFGPGALPIGNSKTVTVEKVNARYQFNVESGTEIDFLTYRVGSNPILTTGQVITADNRNFPISQVGDRNYRDPT